MLSRCEVVLLLLSLSFLRVNEATEPQDIRGVYSLVSKASKDVKCISHITHTSFAILERDTGLIEVFHNSIMTNNKRCKGGLIHPKLTLITTEAYLKNKDRSFSPNQTELERALIKTNAIFGVERFPRECDAGNFEAGTFVAFVRNATSPEKFNKLVELDEGAKYMFIYSTNSSLRNRCLYRDLTVTPIPAPMETDDDEESKGGDGTQEARTGQTVVEDESGGSCFPGSQLVTLSDGTELPMHMLTTSHKIRTAVGTQSPIFTFSHKQTWVRATFVKLLTEVNRTVTLTPDHYIYANGKLTRAGAVRVGDMLTGGDNAALRVTKVEMVEDVGLYAPHSYADEMIVGGVRVSAFTKAVHPRLARMLLAPVKAIHRLVGVDVLGSTLYEGANSLVRWLPSGPDESEG